MNRKVKLNSPEYLAPLVANGRIPARRIWSMLALRSTISFALLLTVAGAFSLAGHRTAVANSAAWWLWFVTAANIVSLTLIVTFGRREGLRLRDIYFADRSTWKGDLTWALVGLAVTAVIAQGPGDFLARLLWGDASYPNSMLFQPLPRVAIYPLFILMPTIHALAELPIYWGYVAPRLKAAGMNRWLVILIVGCVLSVQHTFFAFQLDWRYDLWLAVKFLPFALWMGFLVERRPTVLPYLMGAHFLLDSTLPLLALMATNGVTL